MLTVEKSVEWINALNNIYQEKKEYLTELDSAIGDADHGINMARGFSAVSKELEAQKPGDIAGVLKLTSWTLIRTVGGASGPLYGTLFMKMSKYAEGKASLSPFEVYEAFDSGLKGLQERGKAQVGDKTMVDVWVPSLEKMKQLVNNKDKSLKDVMTEVAEVAEISMKKTVELVAKKGRASYLGERSKGHQDPGATSTYYLLNVASEIW